MQVTGKDERAVPTEKRTIRTQWSERRWELFAHYWSTVSPDAVLQVNARRNMGWVSVRLPAGQSLSDEAVADAQWMFDTGRIIKGHKDIPPQEELTTVTPVVDDQFLAEYTLLCEVHAERKVARLAREDNRRMWTDPTHPLYGKTRWRARYEVRVPIESYDEAREWILQTLPALVPDAEGVMPRQATVTFDLTVDDIAREDSERIADLFNAEFDERRGFATGGAIATNPGDPRPQ